jgi:hypothetical protein
VFIEYRVPNFSSSKENQASGGHKLVGPEGRGITEGGLVKGRQAVI